MTEGPGVGFLPVTALVVGHTIGVGIFLTPAEVMGGLGSPALTLALWVGCAALILAGALTFGELASSCPRRGGLYVYLKEAWGERVAFLYGWQSLLVMDPGITAALAVGMAQYAVVVWPDAAGAETWIAVAAIWALAAISMAGLTMSARVATALTAAKVLMFGAIVLGAFASGSGAWSHFAQGRPAGEGSPLVGRLAPALVSVFFSFGGFWEASRIAGDVRNPTRVVPWALAAGVSCVTVIYVATTAAFIYLVPGGEATSPSILASRLGDALGGGAPVLAGAVVLSVVVSALTLLIMAPRLYVEMGRDGLFPAALAVTDPATGSPRRAILLLAILASAFAALGTLQQIVAFFMCTTLGFLALAAAGLPIVRRRRHAPPPFMLPGYPVTLVLFVLLIVAVTALVATQMPLQASAGLGLALLGLPAYRFARSRSSESSSVERQ